MPKRSLVVLAHPSPDSLAHALAAHARSELERAGHSVDLLDLYASGFDPRLSAIERQSGQASRESHGDTTWQIIQSLRAADNLVFVFPTWWFAPPAIFKGFIDRCFAAGVAFDRAPDNGPIKPLLSKLKNVAIITTLGSPWWVDRLVMGRPVRRTIKTGVIGGCAPKARTRYLALYQAEALEPRRVDRFRTAISRCLRDF